MVVQHARWRLVPLPPMPLRRPSSRGVAAARASSQGRRCRRPGYRPPQCARGQGWNHGDGRGWEEDGDRWLHSQQATAVVTQTCWHARSDWRESGRVLQSSGGGISRAASRQGTVVRMRRCRTLHTLLCLSACCPSCLPACCAACVCPACVRVSRGEGPARSGCCCCLCCCLVVLAQDDTGDTH